MFEFSQHDQDISIYESHEASVTIEDMENDIYYDINTIFKEHIDRLYHIDKFKNNNNSIDIIFPKHSCPGNKLVNKGSDHIRFLLSLYPCHEDLQKISSIIIRPRYIELNGIELISLYIRREKILVLYLHHPHLYEVNNLKFYPYSDFLTLCVPGLSEGEAENNNFCNCRKLIKRVPPLWYILSTITDSRDKNIEKFLIKRDIKINNDIITNKLSDISLYFSRLGY